MGGVWCMARVGMEGLESLESVFDELYEERRSGDRDWVGIEADVRGVREPGEACMALVSSVREALTTFLDWLPILNIDFHAGWLLGDVGDRGWTGRGEWWGMTGLTFSVWGLECTMLADQVSPTDE